MQVGEIERLAAWLVMRAGGQIVLTEEEVDEIRRTPPLVILENHQKTGQVGETEFKLIAQGPI